MAKNKSSRQIISFGQDKFENQQKEQVFKALFSHHLLVAGYIIATPQPDLGDDLWFAKREDVNVRCGQAKSGHTCTINSADIKAPREYCIKLQLPTLRKSLQGNSYVYIVGMADERLRGLARGSVDRSGCDCFLRVEKSSVLENPPQLEFLRSRETTSHIVSEFRAIADGFHFGCIPCSFFETQTTKWGESPTEKKRAENSLWIKVEDCSSDDAGTCFRYTLFKKNATPYFGQTDEGLTLW
ncbi:MAG: hypothetical protein KJ000_26865 [Pirellulaceae bacterium]|nr:hypothetical protein [Pirellulaceae bacterium]